MSSVGVHASPSVYSTDLSPGSTGIGTMPVATASLMALNADGSRLTGDGFELMLPTRLGKQILLIRVA